MKRFGLMLALAAGLNGSGSASAQAPTPLAQCELHVWPGAGLGSVYYGWLASGINNGAVDGRSGYPKVPAAPLDTPVQERLLTETQPQILFHRVDDKLVVHPQALPSRVARATPGRIEPNAGPCYAELIVDTVTLRQDIVNGSHLMTLFRFRDFGSGPSPQWTFGTWVKSPLGKLDGASDGGVSDIRAAYKTNIGLFARALAVAGGGTASH